MVGNRLVAVIPHYYGPSVGGLKWHGSTRHAPQRRIAILQRTIWALHQHFGTPQCMMQLTRRRTDAANTALRMEVQVVVCVVGHAHLLEQAEFPSGVLQHVDCDVPPTELGFACHREMAQRLDSGDWFAYIEDDMLLHDGMFFQKLSWFLDQAGSESILQPNRFERGSRLIASKAYVDGALSDERTAAYQDRRVQHEIHLQAMGMPLRFIRPANPNSSCFFLRRDQLERWSHAEDFGRPDSSFIGPLESAANIGLMRHFRLYKPAIENANFLEIEHQSDQFISQLRTN